MAVEEKVSRLKALLARVQLRASQPRPVHEVIAAPAELEVLEQTLEDDLEELDVPSVDAHAAELDVTEADFDLVDAEMTLEEPEDAPESAPRPAASIGEALDSVSQSYAEDEPLKTPPPESGRQEVTPVPPPPPVAADLEADLSGAPIGRPGAGPTIEQLGEVVELDGAAESELPELEVAPATPSPVRPSPVTAVASRGATTAGPQTFERPPPPAGSPVAISGAPSVDTPSTFLALLDASLSL